MRLPQLVVHESRGEIAELLRGTAGTWKWALRELRQPEACLRALALGHPAIMVLELGRQIEKELALLAEVTWLCPQAPVVVVWTSAKPGLTELAWDLGAAYVLAPPLPRDALLTVVLSLMESAAASP